MFVLTAQVGMLIDDVQSPETHGTMNMIGNHAGALALAAREKRVRCYVVMVLMLVLPSP